MRRWLIAIAAAAVAVGGAACSTSGTQHGPQTSGVRGRWVIESCQIDVTYIDYTSTVDNYVPDTDANFQRHDAGDSSGAAGLAVVVTLVNHTGGPAPLPTGLVVSFTDRSGHSAGKPQTFNNANGTGYGPAISRGHGSGETFSSHTVFNPGQTVAESPDIGGSVPPQGDLSCRVSRH